MLSFKHLRTLNCVCHLNTNLLISEPRWARCDIVRGPETAHRYRPRLDQEPQHPGAGWSHQRPGRRVRASGAGGFGKGHKGSHCAHHRSPAEHHSRGWLHLCHEQWPHCGGEVEEYSEKLRCFYLLLKLYANLLDYLVSSEKHWEELTSYMCTGCFHFNILDYVI